MYSILYIYSTSYLFNIFHLKLKKLPPVLPTQHNCSWMMDILNFNTSDHWVWWSDHNMLVQIIVVQTRLCEHDTPPFPFYRYSTFSSPSTHLHICVCACIKSYTHNFLKNINNVPQFGMRSHRYRRAGVAAATSPDQVSPRKRRSPRTVRLCVTLPVSVPIGAPHGSEYAQPRPLLLKPAREHADETRTRSDKETALGKWLALKFW